MSIIVPLYNEEENIQILVDGILPVMDSIESPFEIILVNDGSWDRTAEVIGGIAEKDDRVKVINLRRNAGQTAAMMAGFDHASGDIIIPMDGDLQNDPADIPRLLAKLDEGYDVVSGWRKDRKDKLIVRKVPSWLANRIISWVSGVKLNDYGCTLKAYRRDVLSGVRLYGELHRFVPIFASWQGGRITELPVNHRARQFGVSKYGLNRIFKVVLDLILVRFLTKYQAKPIYVFGFIAVLFFAVAFVAGLYAVFLKIAEGTAFIQTPLPLLFVTGFMSGMMCILLGLISEVLVRTYFESQGRTHYIIGSTLNIGPAK
ncbi:glycosyltransferase family 2 protein [Microvirga puerhi]|uniref:Glycosyltransferase family 2 protein n=1 Tax=Microvirga puerhi TaxID=2876078 RepID=A0ABS7VL84_9HYPH|nr:glycosyltransferase family 2 protein [Microvirga puerhi]MBZ6076259.1 glycosyltransferase family 2 protein [Microvirga puerhi]